MNTKNVVIAGIIALSVVLGGFSTLAEANASDNEVAKVPTLSADVPLKVELPFLYSQKPFSLQDELFITKTTLTQDVQKNGVHDTPKVASAKEIFEQLPVIKKVEPKVVAKAETKANVQKAPEVKENDFKYYDNIPLDKELQRQISSFAKKKGIEVTLVYALMAQESNFKADVVSKTNDHGIMQINKRNFKWISSDLKKEYNVTFKWKSPYENSVAGIHYLALIKDSWEGKTSSKNLIPTILLSYNMGTSNANKYLKKHKATDWKYVRNIMAYKTKIERGEKVG